MNKLVLDLETKDIFKKPNQRDYKSLKISVVGIYIYNENKYITFTEEELTNLEKILNNTDILIGFNIKRFDIPILEEYMPFNFPNIYILDIMEDVIRTCSFRVSLNNIARTTLGKSKLGTGLDAVKYYKLGLWEKLRNYCLEDVKITKEIYDFGLTNKHILFSDKNKNKHCIPVNWN